MSDTLKLIADELVNAKQTNIRDPKIFIILNQLQQQDNLMRIKAVNDLQQALIEIEKNKDKECLNQILQINKNNIFPL